jgi:hypothetical protein
MCLVCILGIPLMMMMMKTGWKRIWKMNEKHIVLMMVTRGAKGQDLVVP